MSLAVDLLSELFNIKSDDLIRAEKLVNLYNVDTSEIKEHLIFNFNNNIDTDIVSIVYQRMFNTVSNFLRKYKIKLDLYIYIYSNYSDTRFDVIEYNSRDILKEKIDALNTEIPFSIIEILEQMDVKINSDKSRWLSL